MSRQLTLHELLEEKADIHSSPELREAIGGSAAQACNLWSGKDTIGARIMLRLLKAFPQLSVYDLAQVVEARKALIPPPVPKPKPQKPYRPWGHPPKGVTEVG
jgi:hypothetical protein